MPSNKSLVGHSWPAVSFTLESGAGTQYAQATDDTNFRYRGANAIAPPMAVVAATIPHGIFPVCCDEKLIGDLSRLMKLLHAEEDIRWHGSVHPGDKWSVQTNLSAIEEKPSGEFLSLHTTVKGGGVLVAETRSSMFIRERNPNAPKRDDASREAPAPHVVPSYSARWTVAPDQSERYARASGDNNPIHLDDATAQMGGLKGRILHGLCTMAFAQRTVIDHFVDGDASKLKRLRVRFSRPVYMGDTLTCDCREVERVANRRVIEFAVKNQEGHGVLNHGLAELAV